MKRKVLIITNHYLNNLAGGTIASLAYINAFSSIFPDCTLIYPDKETDVRNLLLPSLQMIPCKDNRSGWRKGFGIYCGKIHRFGKASGKAFISLKPDLVVFDTSIVSYKLISLAKELGFFTITIHHNVERDYLRDNQRPIVYRFAYRNHLVRAEREAVRNSNLNLTLTDSDRIRLMSLYSPQKHNIFKISGVFEPIRYPLEKTVMPIIKRNSPGYKFVISGNLSFPQSDISICDFVSTYWPILRSRIKDCTLTITGRNPSQKLYRLCSNVADIQLIPNPENIGDLIAACDYYICPVDRGSGFKFRIMDGLRYGIPVIAHEVSARGYDPFISTGNLLVYNSEISFKKAIEKILNSNFDSGLIQNIYEEFFSFEKGKNRLKAILEEILS